MSTKLSLALFLCLIAASGSSFGAQSQCKFQNQKQQQDCLKQDLANQQAQAQRQQQLQQQRPVATTTPTKPTPAPSKPTLSATPTTSRTAGTTPVTLGNGQRVFVNSQGAYFDASGNPIANQSVSTATKGTPAITPTPAPQVAPAAPVLTISKPTPVASPTSGMTPVTLPNGQQIFFNRDGAAFDASGNPTTIQSVASAKAGTPPNVSTPAPQVVQPRPAPAPSNPVASPAATSHTAGMTPITLGNGQQVFVNSQGSFFDASGNSIPTQSIASATKGAPPITPTPVIGSAATRAQSNANTPATNTVTTGNSLSRSTSSVTVSSVLTAAERARIQALPTRQRAMIENLSPNQIAQFKQSGKLDNLIGLAERSASADREADKPLAARVFQELGSFGSSVEAGVSGSVGDARNLVAAGGQYLAQHPNEIAPIVRDSAGQVLRDIQTSAQHPVETGLAITRSLVQPVQDFTGALHRGELNTAGYVLGQQLPATVAALATDGVSRVVGVSSRTTSISQDPLERMNAGRALDTANMARYRVNQLYVTGGRLDSYVPGVEIISRKSTQLSEITFTAAQGYLRELQQKYAPGTKIKDVPSTPQELRGEVLRGKQVLEVPVQIKPVPKQVLVEAEQRTVIIRDVNGKEY